MCDHMTFEVVFALGGVFAAVAVEAVEEVTGVGRACGPGVRRSDNRRQERRA